MKKPIVTRSVSIIYLVHTYIHTDSNLLLSYIHISDLQNALIRVAVCDLGTLSVVVICKLRAKAIVSNISTTRHD